MIKALEPPFLKTDPIVKSHAGGERRDKARRSARISARFARSGSSATGAAAALLATIISTACMAADDPPTGSRAQPGDLPPSVPVSTDSANPPKHWPPAVQMLSPSAPLKRKSQISVDLVHRWQNKHVMPTMGPRGEVRFIYGATQDTVVGAPQRISDIGLQPGEIVQNINLGDPVGWSCPPAISGSGAEQRTHVMCKPADAGLETTLAIQTNRRSYSVELVSTQKNYMPIVGWSYPDDQVASWAAYQQQMGTTQQTIPGDGYIRYDLSGDNPPWRPITAYSDGRKTYIQFPPAMAYGKAPVLERLP